MSSSRQGDLFGPGPAEPTHPGGAAQRRAGVEPAAVATDLRELGLRLPRSLHLGTSSWSTSGWRGLVYAEEYEVARLARDGLGAYAQHPLYRGVGLDSTFYTPAPSARLERYAQVVPADFRFVVKAWSALTTPATASRPAHLAGVPDYFLDRTRAQTAVVEPLLRALGPKLGALVFQFSPLGRALTQQPAAFVERLARFLEALPRGPCYAVELRDPECLGPDYEAALAAAGAVHCANVHPRMPPVDVQTSGAELKGRSAAPLVIRWMLQPGYTYESAGRRYAPYDRLIDPDLPNRERVATLAVTALSAGRAVHVVANNKAEGSAPLTLAELAWSIDRRRPQPW